MDFRKKLKIRLGVAIGYMALGAMMCVLCCGLVAENWYVFTLGIALIVVGALRLWKHFRTTKSEESIRSQQIAESDERNIAIAQRARSAAFRIYVLIASVEIIVLEIMGRAEAVQMLYGQVCALLVIYWVSYFIIRNKS